MSDDEQYLDGYVEKELPTADAIINFIKKTIEEDRKKEQEKIIGLIGISTVKVHTKIDFINKTMSVLCAQMEKLENSLFFINEGTEIGKKMIKETLEEKNGSSILEPTKSIITDAMRKIALERIKKSLELMAESIEALESRIDKLENK